MLKLHNIGTAIFLVLISIGLCFTASPRADESRDLIQNFSFNVALDPHREINPNALKAALTAFESYKKIILNKKYMTVIDFSLYSGRPRFHLLNLVSGEVESFVTAHGSGSDPQHTGFADKFSNEEGSHMSSLGAFLTDETYDGKHGLSLYLDGLESSNSKARARSIVIHGAPYVDPNLEKMGRSWGCPALPLTDYERVIGLIKNSSLVYIWHH